MKDQKMGAIVIFALVLISVLLLFNSPDYKPKEEPVEKPTKSLALVMSFEYCKRILKAPSTADFDYGGEEQKVKQLDSYTFEITNTVDSENSFGAKLRSTYFCKLKFNNKGDVTCEDCHLLE